MNVNEPIDVTPQYKPVNMLESARIELERTPGGKSVHLSPRQAEELVLLIMRLERKAAKDDKTIDYLAEKLSEYETARFHDSFDSIWGNVEDTVYDE